jgi:hypothetical protein
MPDTFKEDVQRMIDVVTPARIRKLAKIADKDTCKFSFGFAMFVFSHYLIGTLYGSCID